MKRVAIIQSNYIPWKGYFDIINMVDLFIFHDDLKFTKQDWRNRNLIKTPEGLRWLTIPCGSSENRLINQVRLPDNKWGKKHWSIISEFYNKARYFDSYKPFFEDIYLNRKWETLSELNQYIIKKISSEILGSSTIFENSETFNLTLKKEHRIKELLIKCGAKTYLSGTSAKDYLSESFLSDFGVNLEWMDYSNYREYHQLSPPFNHNVSIIDLLFNEGPDAKSFMKSFN